MDGKMCSVSKKGHNFESFLVETISPDEHQIVASDVSNTAASYVVPIIESLTSKRYIVVCKDCGMEVGK